MLTLRKFQKQYIHANTYHNGTLVETIYFPLKFLKYFKTEYDDTKDHIYTKSICRVNLCNVIPPKYTLIKNKRDLKRFSLYLLDTDAQP